MSLDTVLKRLEQKVGREVMKHALGLQAEWRETLSQPGTGITRDGHTASAPGQPPAPDTGTLRNAVQVAQLDPLTAVVGIAGKVKHPESGTEVGIIARSLEHGTRTVEPRPHAQPAVNAYKAKVKR